MRSLNDRRDAPRSESWSRVRPSDPSAQPSRAQRRADPCRRGRAEWGATPAVDSGPPAPCWVSFFFLRRGVCSVFRVWRCPGHLSPSHLLVTRVSQPTVLPFYRFLPGSRLAPEEGPLRLNVVVIGCRVVPGSKSFFFRRAGVLFVNVSACDGTCGCFANLTMTSYPHWGVVQRRRLRTGQMMSWVMRNARDPSTRLEAAQSFYRCSMGWQGRLPNTLHYLSSAIHDVKSRHVGPIPYRQHCGCMP